MQFFMVQRPLDRNPTLFRNTHDKADIGLGEVAYSGIQRLRLHQTMIKIKSVIASEAKQSPLFTLPQRLPTQGGQAFVAMTARR